MDKVLQEKLNTIEPIEDDETDTSSVMVASTLKTREKLINFNSFLLYHDIMKVLIIVI